MLKSRKADRLQYQIDAPTILHTHSISTRPKHANSIRLNQRGKQEFDPINGQYIFSSTKITLFYHAM